MERRWQLITNMVNTVGTRTVKEVIEKARVSCWIGLLSRCTERKESGVEI